MSHCEGAQGRLCGPLAMTSEPLLGSDMRKIATEADVATVLAEPLAVVYKHSPICPTSGIAYEEIRSFRRLHRDVPVYLIDVVHSRPLSRTIADRVGIVHASPQAIILQAGVPAWHGSHFDLRADTMAQRIELLKIAAQMPEKLI
jgi:bacillithiol system protein YtxJ